MNFPVHFLSGVALAEIALISKKIPLEADLFFNAINSFSGPVSHINNSATATAVAISAACCFGAVFPDIDMQSILVRHRTITHWPVLYIALGIFALVSSNLYLFLFCIGALIHLGLDSLTPMGIPMKHPFGRRFSFYVVKKSGGYFWNLGFCFLFGIMVYGIYSFRF